MSYGKHLRCDTSNENAVWLLRGGLWQPDGFSSQSAPKINL